MKVNISGLLIVAVTLFVFSFPIEGSDHAAVTPARAAASKPAVVHLERRGVTITILSSEGGPLYTIKNKEGKVLFSEVTKKELKTQQPELYKFIEKAYAENKNKGAILYHGLDPSKAIEAGPSKR